MRLGQTVGIVIGSLLVILLAITTLLPQSVAHRHSQTLCAPQDRVFEYFNDLEKVAEWSSLVGADGVVREFEGSVGEGARVRLTDQQDRWVSLAITASQSPERVDYHFHTYEDINARASARLAANGNHADITLVLVQEFGTLFGRWAIVFVRSALDEFISEEMERLKARLEEQGYRCDSSASATT